MMLTDVITKLRISRLITYLVDKLTYLAFPLNSAANWQSGTLAAGAPPSTTGKMVNPALHLRHAESEYI